MVDMMLAQAQIIEDELSEFHESIQLAENYRRNGCYKDAIETLKQALDIAKYKVLNEFSFVCNELTEQAMEYREKNQYKDAIKTLNQALGIARKEQEVEVLSELAFIYDELTEHDREYRDQYKDAIKKLAFIYDELAEHEECRSHYENAIKTLNWDLGITQKEQEVEVLNELAFIYDELTEHAREYREKNRHEDAVQGLRQALKAAQEKEKKADVFYEIAVTYDDWKKYEQAIEWYEKFLEIRPDSIEDALYNIATIYSEELKKYEKGAEYYKKYIEIRQDDPDAFFHLGLCHEKSGQSEDALRDYREALDLQIKSDIERSGFSEIYQKSEDYQFKTDTTSNEKIIQYARAILNIAPHDAETLYTLATVYQELKDDKAIQCYQKILDINPETPEPYIKLGDIYTESEEYESAVEAYEKALKIRSDHADALVGLGIISNALGNYYEAMDCYEKAYSSYRNGFVIEDNRILTALTDLGIIYDNQNEIEKATESFSRAWAIGDSQSYIQFVLKNKKYVNEQTIFLLITSANQKEREEEHLRIKLETEKRLFSDLKHTLGNILSTGPALAEEVLNFLREIAGENYQDKEVYDNINYVINLISTFNLVNNLLEMFKFYARKTRALRRKWAEDHGGQHNVTYLFALIFKHELTHIMFSDAFIGQRKRLINFENEDSLSKLRESFLNNVLSLDINPENAHKVLDWMTVHLPVLKISVHDNLFLNERGIRFNFLFVCLSELIYNALKYADGREPVQLIWKEENNHFLFSCRNTFNNRVSHNRKGLHFLTQLNKALGSDFNHKTEGLKFMAEFKVPKKLFSEGAEG
ncbi:tetratricopeptide repeat protein [Desulfobacterales bacterium HSG2]|nr:tetratricopeptide repeat protein [Desulfobacterales bacterium HSG2]